MIADDARTESLALHLASWEHGEQFETLDDLPETESIAWWKALARSALWWQASRPFTEEDVEVAAKTIHAQPSAVGGGCRWEDDTEKTREEFRAEARAALDAVTAHRTNPETGGSE